LPEDWRGDGQLTFLHNDSEICSYATAATAQHTNATTEEPLEVMFS
jgi:hypothetical protein